MAIEYEKIGGLPAYKEALWMRLAFAARYGNQGLAQLLDHHADDLDDFNRALGALIKGENKTS